MSTSQTEAQRFIQQIKTIQLVLPKTDTFGYMKDSEVLLYNRNRELVKAYSNMLTGFNVASFDGGHTLIIKLESMSYEEMNTIDTLGKS